MSDIVGRTAELQTIATALDAAAHRRGLLLSISGEPGIGKSHLAGAGLNIARERGFRVLRGTCARFQADLSFAPLLQVLRPLVDPTDPAARKLTDGLTDLSRLFTWLDLPAPEPTRDSALERSRMFEAVCALLQRAAADRPLAILVDDIHWADPASLDLLAYLTLSLGETACLIVTTDRGVPIESVRRFRALVRRSERVVDVSLGPLHPEQVAGLVAADLGGEPPAPLLELLDRRAQGIPLYVTSLVASLRSQGRLFRSGGRWVLAAGTDAGLPDDLTDVIADRLDELPPAELDILSALGIWGDDATREMIGALLAEDDDLTGRLDRLVGDGFVDEHLGRPVGYRAHHPLVVEAACARLSARERRLLHAAAARHLLGRTDTDRAAAPGLLAHHVRLAGPAFDSEAALNILMTALREEATDRGGRESLLLAEASVALARETGRPDLLPDALERMAESAALAGDTGGAVDTWRAAVVAHGRNATTASRCLRRQALLHLEQGDTDAADHSLDEALALVVDVPGSARERFWVLQLRATFSLRASARDRLRRDLPALRAAAAEVGLPEFADLFEGYVDAGTDRIVLPTAALDVVTLAEGVAATFAGDDPAMAVHWHRPWIVDAIARGDLAEARRRSRLVPEHSAVSPGTFSAAIALEALAEWLAGEWERAFRLTGEALVVAHRHSSRRSVTLALAVRGLIIAHRGEQNLADECIADARAIFGHGDVHTVSAIDTVAGQLAMLRGRTDEAHAVLQRASPVNYLGLLTLTLKITAAARVDDRDRLDRFAGEVQSVAGPWASALARRLDGLRHRDPAALADAAAQLAALGMLYESAQGMLECVEFHPSSADSAQRAADALAVFDRLGAVPAADRARRLLRRLGHRPRPGPRTDGRLSERETQVADLVAQGLSNADIAVRLFISPRTVTTHLERIYRRLGFSSRTELARYVLEASGTGGIT